MCVCVCVYIYIYIYIYKLLWCTPETYNIVNKFYINKIFYEKE